MYLYILFKVWSNVSNEAQDLISKLLELNVEKRLSAKEVLKHPWLIEKVKETSGSVYTERKRLMSGWIKRCEYARLCSCNLL